MCVAIQGVGGQYSEDWREGLVLRITAAGERSQANRQQTSKRGFMYRYFRRLQLYLHVHVAREKSPRICYQRAGRVVQAAVMVGYRDIRFCGSYSQQFSIVLSYLCEAVNPLE